MGRVHHRLRPLDAGPVPDDRDAALGRVAAGDHRDGRPGDPDSAVGRSLRPVGRRDSQRHRGSGRRPDQQRPLRGGPSGARRDRRRCPDRRHQLRRRGQAGRELVHRHARNGLDPRCGSGDHLLQQPAAAPNVRCVEQLHPAHDRRVPDRRRVSGRAGSPALVAAGTHAGGEIPVRDRRQHRGGALVRRPRGSVDDGCADPLVDCSGPGRRPLHLAERAIACVRPNTAAARVCGRVPGLDPASPGAVQRVGDAPRNLRAGDRGAGTRARVRRQLAE